jgi:uncharacterized protein YjiS (DUF1127 family)
MSVIDIHDTPAAIDASAAGLRVPDVSAALARLWRRTARRVEERRTLLRLSRLSPHVVRDMGFEPELIAEALEGSWDEVDLARYLRRR